MSAVKRFQSLLEQGLSEYWQKLYDRSSKQLVVDYKQWKGKSLVYDQDTNISEATGYIYFVQHQIKTYLEAIDSRLHEYNEFHRQFTYAADKEEQQTYLLQFSKTIGASTLQLRKDKKAIERWFDIDALTERYIRIQNDDESFMTYAVSRLATLLEYLWQTSDKESKLAIFNRFEFDSLLLPLLTYKHGDRVKLSAFKAISDIVKGLPQNEVIALPNQLVRFIYRFAIDRAQPVWNQVEALKLIGKLNPKQLLAIYQERLSNDEEQDNDSLFVRHYLVLALADFYKEENKLLNYIPTLLADNKPYVRKAFCDALPKLPEQQRTSILTTLLADESDAVKANAILSMNNLISDNKSAHQYLEVLVAELNKEHAEFVLRTSLHAIIQLLNTAKPFLEQDQYQSWFIAFENALTKLNTESKLTTVRRWASETREQLWAANSEQFEQLRSLFTVAPHKRKRLSKEQRQLLDTEQGLRWLASQTNDQFGFDVGKQHIVREHKEGFRLWRFLFEWKTPATDKRQNYNHTKGRLFYGLNSVPAQKLAEVSATKVPGEPLHIAEDGNWRPYLPLVDQVISSLDQSWPTKPLKIFTNEGVTLVTPPSGFVARLIARTKLTLNFAHYAKLRNWSSEDSNEPSAYLTSLAKLGFTLSIEGHQSSQGDRYPIDAKVARFFPMAIAPPFVMTWWNQYQSYFFSVYQNTLSQLGIFLAAMLTGFLGLHLKANMSMKRARRSIPLVIGGWGSRGKSGTERLKAALFNSLGFSVLSKTTGCEAMFLYSQKNRPLFEMFLFRPFDKATIWEQVNVTRIAKDLKSDVMLWECMGLTPRYIEILQQQWMQDDIATITNCYPDHEDLQGPSGVDIPKVMMKFVPKNSLLLTSEENMLPYLKLAADQNQTKLVNVNWLQAGLITEDVQERFPYQEHPNNIALVVSLAKQLGIDEAFALKEMADKVVPDLGVLKTFPVAKIDGKSIQFINGMSANERFGAIGNWQRTKLDECTLEKAPDTWVTTVINNRDDRVARSRVFAEMMVRDLSVDRHFLIGNNLTGLVGFVEQSWQAFIEEQLPVDEQLSKDQALKVIEQLTTQLKIPTTQELVNNRLVAMCQGENISFVESNTLDHKAYSSPNNDVKAIEEIVKFHQLDTNNLESYITLVNGLEDNNYIQWRQQARKVLWQWFESKLVLVHDYYASGNAINYKLAQSTPPGLLNKVMGMQNIKGTGLDLVYRWQAWDRTHLLCKKLQDTDEDIARDALQMLTKIKDFGVLDKQQLTDSLQQAVNNHYFQTELCQAQITAVESQLESQLALITLDDQEQESSLIDKAIDFIEAFLDTGDAIKRRKKANLIIKDLVNEHISQAMAAQQLQLLTQKQKGGWLKKAIRTRYQKLKH